MHDFISHGRWVLALTSGVLLTAASTPVVAQCEQQKVVASDSSIGDGFGSSISISGDRAAVGAPTNDDACSNDPNCIAGSMYILRRDDNATPSDPNDDYWVEESQLTALSQNASSRLGAPLSISGDWVVVGVWPDRSAYVFRHDDNATPSDLTDDSWVEHTRLVAWDGGTRDDIFGHSVSIHGNYLIVGAFRSWATDVDSGAAYLYRRDDNDTPLNLRAYPNNA